MVFERINFPALPDEILEEILVRLHSDTLVRLTAVCKSWNSLIKSSAFIRAHLNRNQSQHHQILLVEALGLVRVGQKEKPRYLFYLNWDRPPFHVYRNYEHITHPYVAYNRLHATGPRDKTHIERKVVVIGCCNGLVCIVNFRDYTALVWNPCIRKFVMLPRPTEISKNDRVSYGFGYDSNTKDYKVVRIVKYTKGETHTKTSYDIWSLAKPSWNRLGALPPIDNFDPDLGTQTIFFRGALHWLHRVSSIVSFHMEWVSSIVSFDMSSELFGEEIKMPQVMEEGELTISRYKNSLAIFQFFDDNLDTRVVHMWEMKEYGAVDSWTKLVTVELLEALWIERVGFRHNGEAVISYQHSNPLAKAGSLDVSILLNPDSNDNNMIDFQAMGALGGEFADYKFVEPFVESLVLLDHPDAIST